MDSACSAAFCIQAYRTSLDQCSTMQITMAVFNVSNFLLTCVAVMLRSSVCVYLSVLSLSNTAAVVFLLSR